MSARGKKRHCLACGTKYYDLNRTPVVCPKYKTPDGVTKVKKSAVAKPAPEEDEDVDDVNDLDDDVDHQPIADTAEECICLIATDAPMKFNRLLPKLLQPFFGI